MLSTQEKNDLRSKNKNFTLWSPTGAILWGLRTDAPLCDVSGARVMGHGWREFVFSDDVPKVLAWLASPSPEPIIFRALLPSTGDTAWVYYQKTRLRENWLCTWSKVYEPDLLPAMPCLLAEPNVGTFAPPPPPR